MESKKKCNHDYKFMFRGGLAFFQKCKKCNHVELKKEEKE